MRRDDEPMTQLATRIPKEIHRAVRLSCVEQGTTIQEFVIEALTEKLGRDSGRKRARG